MSSSDEKCLCGKLMLGMIRMDIISTSKSTPSPIGVPDTLAESLGARIERLRTRAGFTQGQIASALGVSVPAICNWEAGRSRPKADRQQALADFLGVSMQELLDISGTEGLKIVVVACRWKIYAAAVVCSEQTH